MPTLCPFLTVHWVCLQSVIMHFLAILYHFLKLCTIVVNGNTIVIQIKNNPITREKSHQFSWELLFAIF